MNSLTKSLISELVGDNLVTAVYGGGFKPPTKGHLEVVQKALADFPEIDKFIIYVGSGERNGITQAEAILIWDIYKNYLPAKVEIQPSKKGPIGEIFSYAKNHPEEVVYFVIGSRAGNEEDLQDVALRTTGVEDKYPNVKVKVIETADGNVSGTRAREAAKQSPESFYKFLPSNLTDDEKIEIFGYIQDVVTEVVTDDKVICDNCNWSWNIKDGGDDLYICHKCGHDNNPDLGEASDPEAGTAIPYGSGFAPIKENASYSKDINIKSKIDQLTQHMLDKGYNIEPLPTVEFVDGDSDNARDFFGKTAYYNPNNQTITLYTEGRHPKDIVRSFSHEMVHHIQNLEGRLNNITTTNTQEDDNLNDIEAEANLKGTMTFRNWTDSLNEKKNKDPFGLLEGLINENPSELQKEKINIAFELFDGTKISEDIILAMSPNSQGLFELGDNIEKYSGLTLKDAQEFNETPDDAYIYGLVNTMNDGQDIFFWTNGTRLVGNAKRIGTQTAIIEQLAHEGLHLTRAILAKSLMGDGFPTEEWPSIGEQDNDRIEEEQLTTALSHVLEKISVPFIKMASKYIPELNDQSLSENSLNEGRYDKSANEFSNIVFDMFKSIHDRGDKKGEFEFSVGPDDEDIYSKEFEFDLAGVVEITDGEYEVDGGANAGFDTKGEEVTPLLSVQFKIPKNPDWQRVSFDIKDVVRHELEHLTQDGYNERPGKYMADDQLFRDMIDMDLLPKSDYFKLKKEIDAMLQGLYFKAKKSKRPFNSVIDDYLATQPINAEEKEEILNLWRSRGKALSLPVIEIKGKVMNEVNEQKYNIYCDMDGVLVDFDKQFEKASGGVPPREYEEKNGKEAFWNLIDNENGVGFWVGMPWMPNGKQLWEYIKPNDPMLLSSPSRSNSSRLGKRLWVRNNLPGTKLILANAANKKNYADSNNILIDDRPSNVDQWKAAGGIGILFISTAQTIEELKKLGL